MQRRALVAVDLMYVILYTTVDEVMIVVALTPGELGSGWGMTIAVRLGRTVESFPNKSAIRLSIVLERQPLRTRGVRLM
jgi:hypothetical protein